MTEARMLLGGTFGFEVYEPDGVTLIRKGTFKNAMCLGGLSCHFWFPLKYDPHMEERMLADHVPDEPGPIAQAVAEATPTEK